MTRYDKPLIECEEEERPSKWQDIDNLRRVVLHLAREIDRLELEIDAIKATKH